MYIYIYVYIQLHITIHNHIQLYIYIYSKNTTASKRDMSFIENRDSNFMGIIPTYFQTHPYIYINMSWYDATAARVPWYF